MSIFKGKKPAAAELEKRLADLREKLERLPDELIESRERYAAALALGESGEEEQKKLAALAETDNALRGAVKTLLEELYGLELEEAIRAGDNHAAAAAVILDEISRLWESVEKVFLMFKEKTAALPGFADLGGYAKTPAEILQGWELPDLPEKMRQENARSLSNHRQSLINRVESRRRSREEDR